MSEKKKKGPEAVVGKTGSIDHPSPK